ncbi:MAG: patatin-like phospholipase family protein [candidate division Zixibacteria bacterium]
MKSTVGLILFFALMISSLSAYASNAIIDASPEENIDSVIIVRDTIISYNQDKLPKNHSLKIGLALSGGGTRGIAQVGILKAFEEAGIKISYIAGTSIGSVIGGLYALGYSPNEIENFTRSFDFSTLFSDSRERKSMFFTQREEKKRYLFSVRFTGVKPYFPQGFAAGQRLTSLLTDLTIRANYICGGNFDNLRIPLRVIATDIGSGKEVVIGSGSMADAMRASIAFPLAFTAVDFEDKKLMDGGLVTPIPVDVCRRMGADFVIAVNTASRLLPADEVINPVDVANQVTTIMQQESLSEQLSHADMIITPALADIENYDMSYHDSLITIGYSAGREALSEIQQYLRYEKNNSIIPMSNIESARDDSLLDLISRQFNRSDKTNSNNHEYYGNFDPKMYFHKIVFWPEKQSDSTIVKFDGIPNHSASAITYVFSGNSVFSDTLLNSFFPHDLRILSMKEVKSAASLIIDVYRESGYDLAYIKHLIYDHEAKKILVEIDEGLLQYVDIRGNERTRSWIIKANYMLRPGEPFDTHKSERGLENIYATGFFERVSLDIRPSDKGVHLTINVKEKPFTQLRFGAHWDDEFQSEMFSELLDDNIFGAGIQALTHVTFSSRRSKYFLSLKADRLSKTLLTAQTKGYFSRLRRRLFQPDGAPQGYRIEDRLGGSISAGQQISRLGTFTFEYKLEDIRTEHTLTGVENNQVLSVFAIRSTVETYNKFPYPDYGHRQEFNLEFSGKWLSGTYDEYTKMYSSIEAYWPWGKDLCFNPKLSLGISTADLPDIEKFYIGGMYNFSGYRTHQLVGDKFFAANLRWRLHLPYRLYLFINFDYGNVYDEYEHIKMRDFLKGWGMALSLDTILGPFEFGYGKAEYHPYRMYLNIGLRF